MSNRVTRNTVDAVTDRELELHAALEAADISTLAMVLVQLTGDESILDRVKPHIFGPWDYMQKVPAELKREIVGKLASALARDVPEPPMSSALLRRMMDVCVGQPVPPEYVPMMLELLGLKMVDQAVAAPTASSEAPWKAPAGGTLDVLVIGAGISGLAAAIKLKEAGIPYTVIEKNPAVGGTWYDNSYPGCGVDTPNHFYSFSFEPNHDWTHYFSKRDEILSYVNGVARKYDVERDIRFNTEAVSAEFDEAKSIWKVVVQPDGKPREVIEAKIVVTAVGQLNRPFIPEIPGLDRFKGTVFHTAEWDDDADLRGRRVAMIGTGASGMQVGPAIAGDVEHLTIFQRSPHWVTSNPNYHRMVSEGKKWALKNVPHYAQWYRFQLAWASADGIHASLRLDPNWPTPERSMNATNEEARQALVRRITDEVGDDQELLAKVIPDYPPYGKRMLRDSHWYSTLKRPNVDLVTDGIREITEAAIVSNAGKQYPVDLIVLATGFRAGEMLAPMEIRGRNGKSLRDVWGKDDPKAYLGVTVPGFPNLFVMFGPNTNYAHGGSAIFSAEGQVRYIMQALREMAERGGSTIECKQDVHDAYNTAVDERHSQMVWGQGNVKSWYKNSRGRVFSISPWRLLDHWTWMSSFNRDDYIWTLESGTRRTG